MIFYSPVAKQGNLDTIAQSGSVEFYLGDIVDEAFVAQTFRDSRPQAVIHLAARAGVRPSLEQPLLYGRVNVQGTIALLEACHKFEVSAEIRGFASSSSISTESPAVSPFNEEDLSNMPVSPYAATKIAGEKIAYTYAHLYGLR